LIDDGPSRVEVRYLAAESMEIALHPERLNASIEWGSRGVAGYRISP
jgi:hypothetical protein